MFSQDVVYDDCDAKDHAKPKDDGIDDPYDVHRKPSKRERGCPLPAKREAGGGIS